MGNRQQINKCNNNLNNQNYGVKIKQGKEDGEQGRMRIEDGQYPVIMNDSVNTRPMQLSWP